MKREKPDKCDICGKGEPIDLKHHKWECMSCILNRKSELVDPLEEDLDWMADIAGGDTFKYKGKVYEVMNGGWEKGKGCFVNLKGFSKTVWESEFKKDWTVVPELLK